MPVNTLTKQDVRTIAAEIEQGRGSHTPFVRAWAHTVMQANETQMNWLHTASNTLIDYYHLAGYLQPLGATVKGRE